MGMQIFVMPERTYRRWDFELRRMASGLAVMAATGRSSWNVSSASMRICRFTSSIPWSLWKSMLGVLPPGTRYSLDGNK